MKIRLITLAAVLFALPGLAESAGGVTWTAPAAWKADAPRQMRAATYLVPPAKGDAEGGECAVFFFGPGQGGAVDANIQRWVGQFEGARAPAQKKEKLGGFDVTTLELEGTYQSSMGGPMGPKTPKPGFKLLGAIVEGPEGNVFFKLTGPAKTVDAARADFLKMLKALKK
jgi:hypothetical protein